MSLMTKILLVLIVALSGAILYFYFFRRTTAPMTTTDTNALATQNAQQATQLATLNNQVQDKVGRTELANILQVTQPMNPTPGIPEIGNVDFVKDLLGDSPELDS